MCNRRPVHLLVTAILIGISSRCGILTTTGLASPKMPVVNSINPAAVSAGSGSFILTVTGSNFNGNDTVIWNGTKIPTTLTNSTQAQAQVSASAVASPGTAQIGMWDSKTGRISNTLTFTISPALAAPLSVAIAVSPTNGTVAVGGQLQFTATVSNTTNTAVTWSATGGAISSSGLYTAGSMAGTFSVTATSQADTSKSATVQVTITGISVSVSPPSATVSVSGSQQFVASVSGTTKTAVTWSVASGGGIISSNGLYTAPSLAGTATVQATSVAAPSVSALANVTINVPQISLSVSPTSVSFGSVLIGSSASQPVTLTNTGNSSASISSASTTGSGFAVTGLTFPFSLAAGASTTVMLTFTPSSAGTATGSASFVSNATNSPTIVGLSATAATATTGGATNKWVMGYYAAWQTGLYPVNRIDFSALTHIALAHWMTASNGTLQSFSMDTLSPPIITRAHSAGVKAIMMLGGSDDLNFASAASAANRSTLVNSILTEVNALQLDGVDLDWEININNSDFVALAQALRQARPGLIITAPIDATLGGSQTLAAALAPYCDQVNMMTYGEGGNYPGWVSWYFSALAGDGPDHPASVNLFVNNWLTAGVPAAKIGVGIGFYAKGWTAPVTGALQTIGSATVPIDELPYGTSAANGGGVLSWFYNQPGANYAYDSNVYATGSPQQPSLSIPNGMTPAGWTGAPITWVTYEDEASIAAKAAYVKSQNLGGTIIWTLGEGATDPATGRNPLLDAVKLGFLNSGPASMPLVASTTAYVAGATNIVLTGLPTTLSQVNVGWWNGNTSFDTKVAYFDSYGLPSEYYIEATPDGSSWTALVHVIGNTYNGRQFVFDITGNGYTQVRLRVVSIVGTYAGNVTLNVHDASSNSSDSYLLLGDSITSNCWAAAANAFPNEPFGIGVNAQRPNRYPAATEGGIPGLLSSSPLSTTPYGIPVIRQWLKDFPAIKFVGLSYGTNDANGNVPAATYCSNMQALVQEVIAAGKTPVIPTIVASPSPNVQANAPAMNACLATLESNYPAIIKGPDLWTLFEGHSTTDGWFFDSLHPSLTTGCTALQNAWIDTMISSDYPQ